MMKIIAEWLELKVNQREDGKFEAFESLTNTGEVGTWKDIRQWIENHLLPETEEVINKGGLTWTK